MYRISYLSYIVMSQPNHRSPNRILHVSVQNRDISGREIFKDQGRFHTTPIAKLGRSILRTHCDEYMFPKYEIHYFCNLGIVFLCFWTHREPFRSKCCEFSDQL